MGNLEKAKELWDKLGDIPCDSIEDLFIGEAFLHFPIGTDKLVIWHWFEEEFNLSVATDLMYTDEG